MKGKENRSFQSAINKPTPAGQGKCTRVVESPKSCRREDLQLKKQHGKSGGSEGGRAKTKFTVKFCLTRDREGRFKEA
ncbi:hypothetical protein R1flu_015457 [Riccia fluitans]|uniref:Uncharacterized protein n=1 Tax=Riccia fluitans TaxID=41844 RepID=A0ABD1YJH4_9MARC